jgi:signal transduction histidine kinase
MSDDLVKDLHTTNLFDADGWESGLGKEAADEIARLRAENGRLEAKLAKAVEALEKVRAFVRDLEPYADQGHILVPALREACEALKEIRGETDD